MRAGPFAVAAVCCLIARPVVAGDFDDVCKLLEAPQTRKLFPSAQGYLCKGKEPACAGLSETKCDTTPNCFTRKGSGSGPNCSPCTPNVVVWGCEAIDREQVARQIRAQPQCLKSGGTWRGSCDCGPDALFLARTGCTRVEKLCTDAGGVWVVLDHSAQQISEFLPLADCQTRAKPRWEPAPRPPVGLCLDSATNTSWPCDQRQRNDLQKRGILKGYQEQSASLVLCTYEVKERPPASKPLYQDPAPGNTNTLAGSFCRKDGLPFQPPFPRD